VYVWMPATQGRSVNNLPVAVGRVQCSMIRCDAMMIERDPLRKYVRKSIIGRSVPTCEEEKDATGLLQAARSVMYVCSHVEIELWRRARPWHDNWQEANQPSSLARNGIFGLLSTGERTGKSENRRWRRYPGKSNSAITPIHLAASSNQTCPVIC
jgi:hypothetical protein